MREDVNGVIGSSKNHINGANGVSGVCGVNCVTGISGVNGVNGVTGVNGVNDVNGIAVSRRQRRQRIHGVNSPACTASIKITYCPWTSLWEEAAFLWRHLSEMLSGSQAAPRRWCPHADVGECLCCQAAVPCSVAER